MKKLLFFGDLAPKYLSGTSISAKINLDILKEAFQIFHIEEGDNWKEHQASSWNKVKRNLKHAYNVFRLSRKQKIDILYSHLPSSTAGVFKILIISMAAKLSGVQQIVLHLHRGDYYNNYSQSKSIQILHKTLMLFCNKIISLSQDHKKSLFPIVKSNKIGVVENTIEREIELESNKGNAKALTFVCISNYIEEKGILDLLKVFKNLETYHSDIRLELYGNSFNPEFTSLVRSYHNDESIIVNDAISGENKFIALRNADCFILPSWNEGQPLVILEAMSQACPIIASTVGFVPELLGKQYPYLYEAKNLKDLEEKINTFIQEKPQQLGNQLLERYQSEYSQAAHRQKILDIFKQLS